MQKIAICDACDIDRASMRQYCFAFSRKHNLECEIQEFTSGESLLEADFPDVLLLEINLGRVDGLLVKQVYEKKNAKTRILFVSNELSAMEEAFGKNVFGFLRKPIDYARLELFLAKMAEDVARETEYMFCRHRKKIEKIYYCNICYIESYGRYSKVHIRGETEYRLSDQGISEWAEALERYHFSRCHREFLVNLAYIQQIDRCVTLKNGVMLSLGESKGPGFKKKYEEFIRRKENGQYDGTVLQKQSKEYVRDAQHTSRYTGAYDSASILS